MKQNNIIIPWLILATMLPAYADVFEELWNEKKVGVEYFNIVSTGYLPLEHTTEESLNKELNSVAFRNALSKNLEIDQDAEWVIAFRIQLVWRSPEPEYSQKYPEESFRMKAVSTTFSFQSKAIGLSEDQFKKLNELVEKYLEVRREGHTAEFASYSLKRKKADPFPQNEPLRTKILTEHPEIPPSMLVRTSKTGTFRWQKPESEDSTEFEYHVFKVVDGPITWEYQAAEDYPYITIQKHDSQEDDPKKAPLFDQARKEVDDEMNREGIKGQFGSCHKYWARLKKRLKEKHAIDWLSPKELHPNSIYD